MMVTDPPIIGDGWDDVELLDDEELTTCVQVGETRSSIEEESMNGEGFVVGEGDSILKHAENKNSVELSSFRVGSGFFMGRLTRFLDPTIPQSEETDVGPDDGWKEDSFDLGDIDTESKVIDDCISMNDSNHIYENPTENGAEPHFKRIDTVDLDVAESGGSRNVAHESSASLRDDDFTSTFKRTSTAALEMAESGNFYYDMNIVVDDCENHLSNASDEGNFVNGDFNEIQQWKVEQQVDTINPTINHPDEIIPIESVSLQPDDAIGNSDTSIAFPGHVDTLEYRTAELAKIGELEQKLILADEQWLEMQRENNSEKTLLLGQIEDMNTRILEHQYQVQSLEHLSSQQKSCLVQYDEKTSHLQYQLDCTLSENVNLQDTMDRLKNDYSDKVCDLEESVKRLHNQNMEMNTQLMALLLEKEEWISLTKNNIKNETGTIIVTVEESLDPRHLLAPPEQSDTTTLVIQLNQRIVELEEILRSKCETQEGKNQVLIMNQRNAELVETIKVLNQKETEIMIKLKELSTENNELSSNLLKLKDESEALKKSLDQRDNVISSLESNSLRMSDEIVDRERRILELEKTIDTTTNAETDMMAKLKEILTENNELSSNLLNMTDESEALTKSLDQRDKVISSLESDCLRMSDEIAGRERRIRDLEETMSTVNHKETEIMAKLNEVSTANDELSSHLRHIRDESEALKKSLDQKDHVISSLESDCLRMSDDIVGKERRILELEESAKTFVDLKNKGETLQTCLFQKEETISSLEQQIAQLNHRLRASEDINHDLQEKSHLHEQNNAVLQCRVDAQSTQIQNLQEENEEILVQLGYFITKRDETTDVTSAKSTYWPSEKTSLIGQIDSLNVTIGGLEAQLVNLDAVQQEYHSLTAKLDELVGRFSNRDAWAGDSYQAIVHFLEESERKISHQENKIASLEECLDTTKVRKSAIEEELGNSKNLIDSLQLRLEHDTHSRRNQDDAYKESDVEYVTDLESMLKIKSEDNNILLQRLHEQSEQISDLQSMQQTCNATIEKLSVTAREQADEIERFNQLNISLQKQTPTTQASVRVEEFLQLQEDFGKLKEALDRKTATESYIEMVNLSQGTRQDVLLKEEVVRLAVALEKAETKRADTLEDLVKERKAYAASLKTINESLKQVFAPL